MFYGIDVGAELRRLFAADRAGLIVPTAVGRPQELLAPVGDAEAAYAAYFHSVDPIRRQAQRDFAEAPQHPHLQARGSFVEVDGVVQPAPALRFSHTPSATPTPPRAPDAAQALRGWLAPEGLARWRAVLEG